MMHPHPQGVPPCRRQSSRWRFVGAGPKPAPLRVDRWSEFLDRQNIQTWGSSFSGGRIPAFEINLADVGFAELAEPTLTTTIRAHVAKGFTPVFGHAEVEFFYVGVFA